LRCVVDEQHLEDRHRQAKQLAPARKDTVRLNHLPSVVLASRLLSMSVQGPTHPPNAWLPARYVCATRFRSAERVVVWVVWLQKMRLCLRSPTAAWRGTAVQHLSRLVLIENPHQSSKKARAASPEGIGPARMFLELCAFFSFCRLNPHSACSFCRDLKRSAKKA